jgi:FKBP12-rapamycin complex-associated protein
MRRYKQCYDESTNGFDEVYTREKGVNRDDRVHGSLLVLNELLRCSNAEWERSYEELMDRVQYQQGQQANVSSVHQQTYCHIKGFVAE